MTNNRRTPTPYPVFKKRKHVSRKKRTTKKNNKNKNNKKIKEES
jgi:hypothetical protein